MFLTQTTFAGPPPPPPPASKRLLLEYPFLDNLNLHFSEESFKALENMVEFIKGLFAKNSEITSYETLEKNFDKLYESLENNVIFNSNSNNQFSKSMTIELRYDQGDFEQLIREDFERILKEDLEQVLRGDLERILKEDLEQIIEQIAKNKLKQLADKPIKELTNEQSKKHTDEKIEPEINKHKIAINNLAEYIKNKFADYIIEVKKFRVLLPICEIKMKNILTKLIDENSSEEVVKKQFEEFLDDLCENLTYDMELFMNKQKLAKIIDSPIKTLINDELNKLKCKTKNDILNDISRQYTPTEMKNEIYRIIIAHKEHLSNWASAIKKDWSECINNKQEKLKISND